MNLICKAISFKKVITSFSGLVLFFISIETPNLRANSLTFCKDSTVFEKRLVSSLNKVQKQSELYPLESKERNALENKIVRTKARFSQYSRNGLLCGADGLPHLIANLESTHFGEFVAPGLIFLYLSGLIGWSGRKYLICLQQKILPAEGELIIDVPLFLNIIGSCFFWPAQAIRALASGELIANKNTISQSIR